LLGVERLSVKRPWQVIAGFALLLAVAVFGISQIHVETDMLARLSPESSARQDAEYFQQHFAGDSQLEVFIDSGRKDGALDPRLLADVLALQEDIAAIQGVDKVGSLVDLLEQIHAALGAKDGGRLPKSRKALAEYLVLFEMQGGKNLGRLVDFDRQMIRMGVRVAPTGVVAIYDLGEQVKSLAAKRLGDRATVEASGMAYMLGEWIDDILNGQRNGLFVSILTIALMMIGVCRSIRVGLLSMLPNLLPLLVLGGYVGLFWDQVDTDTLTIAMLAIGIGVDDTIHFLSRYRIEANRHDDDVAIARTFNFAGRAILITTVILVLGFLPMAASNYFSTRIVGTLLPMTLIVALLADLLLVPALVKVRIMSLHRGS
jgi:predicted RND superfamily exporter protein